MSKPYETCGFGLQVGKDGLRLHNVYLMAELYGLVDYIVIYACGPANTASGNAGTMGDGSRFCTEMASWTGANVIASSSIQYYDLGVIHFHTWPPPVYEFKPDCSKVKII